MLFLKKVQRKVRSFRFRLRIFDLDRLKYPNKRAASIAKSIKSILFERNDESESATLQSLEFALRNHLTNFGRPETLKIIKVGPNFVIQLRDIKEFIPLEIYRENLARPLPLELGIFRGYRLIAEKEAQDESHF